MLLSSSAITTEADAYKRPKLQIGHICTQSREFTSPTAVWVAKNQRRQEYRGYRHNSSITRLSRAHHNHEERIMPSLSHDKNNASSLNTIADSRQARKFTALPNPLPKPCRRTCIESRVANVPQHLHLQTPIRPSSALMTSFGFSLNCHRRSD